MNKVYNSIVEKPPGVLLYVVAGVSFAMYGLVGDVFVDVEQATKTLYAMLMLVLVCALYTSFANSDSVPDGHPVIEAGRMVINMIQHTLATAMLVFPLMMLPSGYLIAKSLMTPMTMDDATADPKHVKYMTDLGFDLDTSVQIVLRESIGQRVTALRMVNEAAEKMDPPMDPTKRFRATQFVIRP